MMADVKIPSQFERVKEIAEYIKYKPNAHFEVAILYGYVQVILVSRLPDINAPENEATLRFIKLYRPTDLAMMTDKQILEQFMEQAVQWEEHEAREWFRYRELKIFDPHGSRWAEGKELRRQRMDVMRPGEADSSPRSE